MARLDALQRAWPMSDASDLIGELSILYFAMSKFKTHFPAIGMVSLVLLLSESLTTFSLAPALSRVGKRLA